MVCGVGYGVDGVVVVDGPLVLLEVVVFVGVGWVE